MPVKFDETKHPRDRRGRFTKSRTVKASAADRKAVKAITDGFKPAKADKAYAAKIAAPEHSQVAKNFALDAREINEDLRAGHADAAGVKPMDAAMRPLPEDLVLHRLVPDDAFGDVNPADLQGMKVRDAGFSPTQLEQHQPSADDVRMFIAAPAGSRAVVNADTGEVYLDRDSEMVVSRVEANSAGGHDMYLTVLPKVDGKGGQKNTAPANTDKVADTPATKPDEAGTPGALAQAPTAAAEAQIRDALADYLTANNLNFDDHVMLADLRDALPDMSKAEFDKAVVRMNRDDDVHVIPESNQKLLTDRERAGAVRIGNQNRQVIVLSKPPADTGRAKDTLSPKARPEPADVDKPDSADDFRADLMKLKVPELQAKMRERGLKPGKLRKSQMVDALVADETGDDEPANKEKAAPARKGPAPDAATKPETPAGSAEDQIRSAVADITRSNGDRDGDWVNIAQLRAALPDMDRDEFDNALRSMIKQPGVNVEGRPDRWRLTQADHDAAVMIAGEPHHLIAIQNQKPPAATSASPGGQGNSRPAAKTPDAAHSVDAAPLGLHRADNNLTEHEQAGLSAYQDDSGAVGFQSILGALRSGGTGSGRDAAAIAGIDSAMARSSLSEDVTVYRSVRSGQGMFGDRVNGDLTEMRWREDGYVSTAVDEVAVVNFELGRPNAIRMTIKAPAGTGAVDLTDPSDPSEAELLLDRGHELEVTADHGVVDGVRRLDVRVLPKVAEPAARRAEKSADVPATKSAAVPAAKPAPVASPSAQGKLSGAKSAQPVAENTWGGLRKPGDVHFHDDGKIGTAVKRMGEDRLMDVDGQPLATVLGRVATDAVTGKITTQAQLDQLKALHARLPDGKAKQRLGEAILDLDAPMTPAPDIPDGTPAPLRDLVSKLHGVPLVRQDPNLELEPLTQLIADFHAGKIRGRRLVEAVEKLKNRRHESYEGKAEIDAAVAAAVAALNQIGLRNLVAGG